MAYSGKYKPKNPAKYKGDHTKVIYRSMWERHCFKWCDENPMVKNWSSEEVVIPYFYEVDKKYHRYFMDLKITWKTGKVDLIEIKPENHTVKESVGKSVYNQAQYIKNKAKWEAAAKYCKQKGIQFRVVTEKD